MDLDAIRDQFPVTRNYNFQNNAAVAPLSRPAAEAIRQYASRCEASATIGDDFYVQAERVRTSAARMIQADPDEVTFVKNTTEGIGWVANGLDWNNGDNVVTTNVEFPANVYPWMDLASRGVQMIAVPEQDGRLPVDRISAAINQRTRIVSISAVQYASGYRADLARLGAVCRGRGVLFCVDAIQSLGVFPIDVKEMQIDFLSADGHKWLCSPEGCGMFYCRKDLIGQLKPLIAGWLGMKNAMDFGHYQFEFVDSARRFDIGSYNLAGIHALGASIELLMGIGIDQIASHVLALTDRLVKGVMDKGYRVISSRREGEASGIVMFVSEAHDHESIREHLLTEHRVVIACREGRLRASPHVYNTPDEIDELVDLLPDH